MKRYNYKYFVVDNNCLPTDKICNFNLLPKEAAVMLARNGNIMIRVSIPKNMKLIKKFLGMHHITEDNRTLEELKYDVVALINNEFVVKNYLKKDIATKQPKFVKLRLAMEDNLILTKYGMLTEECFEEYVKKGMLLNENTKR